MDVDLSASRDRICRLRQVRDQAMVAPMMRTIQSFGLLLAQAGCAIAAAACIRWLMIDNSAAVSVVLVVCVTTFAGAIYVRDGMLIHDGAERAMMSAPREESRRNPRRLALPEEFIATVEQLQGHIEETQASAAQAVAVGRLAAEIMYGVDRKVASIEDENVALRDDGARMDASLNAIAQVVQERTGPPMPSSPMRRTFDGRGSEPALDEPRVAMRPRPIDDDPVPAFLTKPRVDLSELEEAIHGTQGRE